jgi:hypothetical protein
MVQSLDSESEDQLDLDSTVLDKVKVSTAWTADSVSPDSQDHKEELKSFLDRPRAYVESELEKIRPVVEHVRSHIPGLLDRLRACPSHADEDDERDDELDHHFGDDEDKDNDGEEEGGEASGGE